MARTNLPTSTFVLPTGAATSTGLLDPAGTAIDQANGMNIALASGALPSAPTAHNLYLRVNNSAAGPHNVIVRAGAYPPAFRAGLGDLTVSVVNATTRWIGPFEAARHMQADGSINVDFDAGTTGTITAFLSPEDQQ